MKGSNTFRSVVATELSKYISLKQALGRWFDADRRTLLHLDKFLCDASEDLTPDSFKKWCASMTSVCSNTKLARIGTVRNFCLYRQRSVPDCFIPNRLLFPAPTRPVMQPYVFSEADVERLLDHTALVPNSVRSPLREDATRLAIILLYSTGLRRGELLRLTLKDYNSRDQALLIRESKFHKSRLLPLPPDVATEFDRFLKRHAALRPAPTPDTPLLWNPYCGGRAYSTTQFTKNMRVLFKATHIRKPNGRFPRIHDFRFSFAINALIRWYRDGIDVQSKLPLLAAYMGHVSILSTYYYLRFIEPLAQLASEVFAKNWGSLIETNRGDGS
jgi:integrase/recombinase XerD